jgi:hypothetical protein
VFYIYNNGCFQETTEYFQNRVHSSFSPKLETELGNHSVVWKWPFPEAPKIETEMGGEIDFFPNLEMGVTNNGKS